MSKIRILYCLYGLNIGGAETFVYNVYSKIDKKLFEIDFALQDSTLANEKLVDLINCRGGKIHILPNVYKSPVGFWKGLRSLLKTGQYSLVHYHVNALINVLPIIVCKNCKVPLIVHSHSTSNAKGGFLGQCLHKLNSFLFANQKFEKLACGPEAGHWCFPKGKFTIIENAIDMDRFAFNVKWRNDLQNKMNPDHKCVIGHVGRLAEAKNHKFLVSLFSAYKQSHPDSLLIIVGDGELREKIEEQVSNSGLQSSVIFTGSVQDPERYFSFFDCFVFPSLYEGLPFTLIEAQASGIPIVASTNIAHSAKIIDDFEFLSLDNSLDVWIKAIDSAISNTKGRNYNMKKAQASDFNINNSIKKLEAIYIKLITKELKTA